MGRKTALASVPQAVLAELGRRYIEQPNITIDQHTAWLSDKGHVINRSSVHRYLQANLERLSSEQAKAEKTATDAKSIRLGCMMVAASFSTPGDKVDLLNTAEEFAAWVEQPTSH